MSSPRLQLESCGLDPRIDQHLRFLLNRLVVANISISVDGGDLILEGHGFDPPAELVADVRAAKPRLLALHEITLRKWSRRI